MLKQRKDAKLIKEEICNIQWDVGFTLERKSGELGLDIIQDITIDLYLFCCCFRTGDNIDKHY